MNYKTKCKVNRCKKSLFSGLLALILMLSFNYAPIACLANLGLSNAYKSSSTGTYYTSSSSTDSSFSDAKFPSSLKDYFFLYDDSNGTNKNGNGKNFNIEKYYLEKYNETLSYYLENFLKIKIPEDSNHADYGTNYKNFLKVKNYKTLLAYYQANSSSLNQKYSVNDYKSFVEYFVANEWTWRDGSEEKTLEILYSKDASLWRSNFYNDLYKFMTGDASSSVEGNDGVEENSEFYNTSVTYKKVKEKFDAEISKKIAIYTADGTTQNKNIAAIIANNVPTQTYYYYKDGTDYYVKSDLPASINYVTDANGNNVVYYFRSSSDPSVSTTNYTVKDYSELLNDDPLLYVQITSDDPNYNSRVPLYYKYNTTNNEKSKEFYVSDIVSGYANVYVLNDSPTLDDEATYESLKFQTITNKNLTDDINGFYVKVPYSATNTAFFEKISKYQSSSDEFKRFVSTFTNGSESILYLKLKPSTAKMIYVDESAGNKTRADLMAETGSNKYIYQTKSFVYNNLSDYDKKGYVLVDSTYQNTYYRSNYKLYFKKTVVPYEQLDTSDSAYTDKYETTSIANVTYEQASIPTNAFEKHLAGALAGEKVIYVLNDQNVEIGGITYTAKTLNELNAVVNEYVSVPKSVSDRLNNNGATSYKFYYKHTLSSQNKIYVVDNTTDTTTLAVYGNLYYNVITEKEYELNYSKYITISSGDSNYNKNFKLYYKYTDLYSDDLYIKNKISNKKQIYVVDDSLTDSDISTYVGLGFYRITSDDYSNEPTLYVPVPEEDKLTGYKDYEKLYYKYKPTTTKKTVYLYSSKSSSIYKTFYNTNKTDEPYNYVSADYERIEPTLPSGEVNPDYVEGLELYYKRIRKSDVSPINIVQNTYYTYQSASKLTLKSNSYYMLSFYVYTNGTNSYDVNDGAGTVTTHSFNVEASVYLKDTNNNIKDIVIDKISTNGKWKKYCMFVATDAISDSSVNLLLAMGNEDSILGSAINEISNITEFSGTVLFDNIKVTKINETDFRKHTVDDKDVADTNENETIYVDKTTYPNNTYENNTTNNVKWWDGTSWKSWDNMFNLANLTPVFGDGTNENPGSLTLPDVDSDGYQVYNNMWQYYIGRDVSGQGNGKKYDAYKTAYENKNVELSIINESTIFEDKKKIYESTSSSEDNSKENDKDDVKYVESTFEKDNKILKIKNNNRQYALGVTSNNFIIEQSMYYKLTAWIYATEKEAKTTIVANSLLKTSSSSEVGKLIQASAEVNAYLKDYATTPSNEYGWIPITLYIEGNQLHDQEVSLALLANQNSTVYFDNITIQKTTSASYDTAKSDSDDTTYTMSLSGDALMAKGVTNGFFNNTTVTSNYNLEEVDFTTPRKAKSWTEKSTNSSAVIAGVIPTNNSYIAIDNNFYSKYNGGKANRPTMPDDLFYNVYAMYLPSSITAPISNATSKTFNTTNTYKIYSSSTSLSAGSVYKISFDFYAGDVSGYEFKGKVVSTLYHDSVADDKVVTSMSTDSVTPGWNTFTYYVQTGNSSLSAYIEIGVENAVGTCFIKNVTSEIPSDSPKTIEAVRDKLLANAENNQSNSSNLYEKDSLKNVKFVNLLDYTFDMHNPNKDTDTNLYNDTEYTTDLTNNTTYTVGKTGIAVASYYDSTSKFEYSVTIDKTEYYIGEVKDESGNVTGYKLYSDSTRKTEVSKIDSKDVIITSPNKVTIGTGSKATDYTSTKTEVVSYNYKFNDDVYINGNYIEASELNNNHSQNVLILSNGKSTDYISVTPTNKNSLKTSAFYVLKIYVKTGGFTSNDFGLNIKIDSISTSWTNINTANKTAAEGENGFICYQVLITTNTSSVANVSAEISLGSEKETGKGYAMIAGIELENYSTEKLFNEYVETLQDDDTTIKKFYGTTKDSSSDDDDGNSDDDASNWTATFFYIFSSLLLGVVLIVALVAVFLKKRHKKVPERITNDSEREKPSKESSKNKSKSNVIDVQDTNQKVEKSSGDKDINGFI